MISRGGRPMFQGNAASGQRVPGRISPLMNTDPPFRVASGTGSLRASMMNHFLSWLSADIAANPSLSGNDGSPGSTAGLSSSNISTPIMASTLEKRLSRG